MTWKKVIRGALILCQFTKCTNTFYSQNASKEKPRNECCWVEMIKVEINLKMLRSTCIIFLPIFTYFFIFFLISFIFLFHQITLSVILFVTYFYYYFIFFSLYQIETKRNLIVNNIS